MRASPAPCSEPHADPLRALELQCRAMAFPLFSLPSEAAELVHDFVGDLEDKRALRLVCKRSRALVDRRVVAVKAEGGARQGLWKALLAAPWRLLRLDLAGGCLTASAAKALAAAPNWAGLQTLTLSHKRLGSKGAAALAAAHWPALEELALSNAGMDDGAAAALASSRWAHLKKLDLSFHGLTLKGAKALASGARPELETLDLYGYSTNTQRQQTLRGSSGSSALARPPGAHAQLQPHRLRGRGGAGGGALAPASKAMHLRYWLNPHRRNGPRSRGMACARGAVP